ncbi:MAG TPA: hypothetical protein VKI65_02765 [Gemmataceae bacterium]|nr:hypothetical protein [Gemmataceae bacterium]
MSTNQLGPIELCCDAPPYSIVKACRLVEFRQPEDVRWLRASRDDVPANDPEYARVRPRESPVNFPMPSIRCSCGQTLPALEKFQFFFASGSQTNYLLGQCPGCGTIYWDEPS